MIRLNLLLELKELFDKKKWDTGGALFENYLETLKKLNEEEQKIIFELSEEFIWIKYSDYLNKIKEILSEIYLKEKQFNDYKELYIVPLLNLEESLYDKNLFRTKSSNFMCYLFKSNELKEHIFLEDKKVNIIEKPYCLIKENNEIKEQENPRFPNTRIKNSPKKAVILVDDFIGSGETALEAINYLKEKEIPEEKIIILSIAILSEGYNKLRELGIRVYYTNYIKKSITEKYFSEEEEEKRKETIRRIVEKLNIPIKAGEEFGYNMSECLISLIRTPNNTMPIFREFFPRW